LKGLGEADTLLAGCEIAGERRAETLTVAEFDRLARALLARG
jgi:16S rRNA (adenine1518-N6/adenine1519-N6)-dimethyltransferase